MTRRLTLAGIVAAAFVVVLALTCPTDAAVRAVLARLPLPSGLTIEFAGAHLRPNGLLLDDVVVTGPDGRQAFAASWLRLRPSLWGLIRDRTGRPWSIGAALCQGEIAVTLGADGRASAMEVIVRDVELASCVPYLRPGVEIQGHLSGEATVRLPEGDAASGTGTVALRGFAWQPGSPLEDTRIRADQADARWRLGEQRLIVEPVDAKSSDFDALGHGTLRWVGRGSDGTLDLVVTITPGPTMPSTLRRLVDAVEGAPPTPAGSRTFRIQGTLGAPRITAIRLVE